MLAEGDPFHVQWPDGLEVTGKLLFWVLRKPFKVTHFLRPNLVQRGILIKSYVLRPKSMQEGFSVTATTKRDSFIKSKRPFFHSTHLRSPKRHNFFKLEISA